MSNEQESLADEGDNDYDDDSDDDAQEDENSSSDSQRCTDEDDSVWSCKRDLSWTSELTDTFDDKKAELVERGMSASDAHQAAYRCVLPNFRPNITTNYMKKICQTANFAKTISIEKSWKPNVSYKKMMIMNL